MSGAAHGDWKEMFQAACDGDLALVAYHVGAGVDVNYAHPEFLSTPLVAAILAGQAEVAAYLLAQGAQPDLRSEFDDNMRPIEAARRAGLPALEAQLLALGVPAIAEAAAPAPAAGWRLWRLWTFWRFWRRS